MKDLKKVLDTRSNMWCIWNPEIGIKVNSYSEWEDRFFEDRNLVQLIQKKLFVPINLNNSGSLEFTIRFNDANILSQREKDCFLASSNDYLIKSDGLLYVSGIEYIEENINTLHVMKIESISGLFNVKINIIDWKKESEFVLPDGTPATNALSDFIIHFNTYNENIKGSDSLNTFNM